MSKKNRRSRVTPQAPLITDMDALSYIRYRPWADAETLDRAFEMEEIDWICLIQYFPSNNGFLRETFVWSCVLERQYFDKEFLRSPQCWDWVPPEERYPPEIRDWKREHRMRFDGGQGLSDRKRELIQNIVQPIWEDARYTFGRSKDLLEEVQRGITIEGNVIQTRNFMMHRDFLLRIIRAIDSGLSAETDMPQHIRAAIVSLLTPMMREQDRLYQNLLEALGIVDRSISIN